MKVTSSFSEQSVQIISRACRAVTTTDGLIYKEVRDVEGSEEKLRYYISSRNVFHR